ncbi:hypothetical protein ACIBJE_05510 [Micromonospora sp. NPDC050187]|uniref:hypothetical protein n=1 Tax=Micromonospora sp. NPDC050187 TaxID=3364277 RepID=UPI0037A5E542
MISIITATHADRYRKPSPDDPIEDLLARLRTHGAELVGELERYEDRYRLCHVGGPEGIIAGPWTTSAT